MSEQETVEIPKNQYLALMLMADAVHAYYHCQGETAAAVEAHRNLVAAHEKYEETK